jgi:hypothetical protein
VHLLAVNELLGNPTGQPQQGNLLSTSGDHIRKVGHILANPTIQKIPDPVPALVPVRRGRLQVARSKLFSYAARAYCSGLSSNCFFTFF